MAQSACCESRGSSGSEWSCPTWRSFSGGKQSLDYCSYVIVGPQKLVINAGLMCCSDRLHLFYVPANHSRCPAVSKDGGRPFFALGEIRKISTIYSAIFDIFDLNVHVISFSFFCYSVLNDFLTFCERNANNQGI